MSNFWFILAAFFLSNLVGLVLRLLHYLTPLQISANAILNKWEATNFCKCALAI